MVDSTRPSKPLDRFVVRLPDGMRDKIKAAADQSNRSMNAEIIYRLERSFALQVLGSNVEDLTPLQFLDLLRDMQARFGERIKAFPEAPILRPPKE